MDLPLFVWTVLPVCLAQDGEAWVETGFGGRVLYFKALQGTVLHSAVPVQGREAPQIWSPDFHMQGGGLPGVPMGCGALSQGRA